MGAEVRKLANQGERDAARLLETSWWDDEACSTPVPVEPKVLAERLEITVEETWLDPDESGRIELPASGRAIIYLNMFDHPNRQRFTCAHELGHYVRRRQTTSSHGLTFVDYRNTLAGAGVDREEIYANQFAAALLMPAHLVELNHRRDDVVALAQKFGTSPQAFELRLRNLGLT